MPDVLDIVVVLQHINELLHILQVALIREGDVVLGHHGDIGREEGVALVLQCFDHSVEVIGLAADFHNHAVGLEVGSAGLQSVHHHGVLVQFLILIVNDNNALLIEAPGHTALCAQIAVALIKSVADFGSGTLTVVGQSVHDYGHAAGAVALIGDGLEVLRAAGTQGLVDGALDVVVGHIDGLGLGNHSRQTGVIGGIAGAAAFLHGHNDLFCNFGECSGTLCVSRALGFLNIMPFRMSGHSCYSPSTKYWMASL